MLWSWRPDAGVKLAGFSAKRRRQTSPVTGESTKQAVKTIARGMPGDFRCDYARVLCFILHARPAPSVSEDRTLPAKLAFTRGEIAKLWLQRMPLFEI